MSKKLHNKRELLPLRKDLRNNGTSAEGAMWSLLKKKQVLGIKFRRQHSVANYILDFYCPEKKLAIELDGAHHYTPEGLEKDKNRDAFLELHGIKTIRFENKRVFEEPSWVIREVELVIQERASWPDLD
ncbi:MAG: endonuclease domain-containing protein [Flavobacteriales bacterium]